MVGGSDRRILVIEDGPNWQRLIGDLVRRVSAELGIPIEVVVVSRFDQALDKIETVSYDCITVDNELPAGKMGKALVDRILSVGHRVPVVVVSGKVTQNEVWDLSKEYDIDGFFYKGDGFDPKKFRDTIAKLLTPVQGDNLEVLYDREMGGTHVNWNAIISLAVSAVSPYATAFATSAASAAGKELIEAASENVKGLWQWIRETISGSDDESAKQTWKKFEKDPESNKDALIDIIQQLSPNDDTVLRGCVQGVIQEIERRGAARLYTILETRFMLNDVRRVASRINPQWEDELGSDPNKTKLATWVINYAETRIQLPDLIAAMLEVNPTVVLQ